MSWSLYIKTLYKNAYKFIQTKSKKLSLKFYSMYKKQFYLKLYSIKNYVKDNLFELNRDLIANSFFYF